MTKNFERSSAALKEEQLLCLSIWVNIFFFFFLIFFPHYLEKLVREINFLYYWSSNNYLSRCNSLKDCVLDWKKFCKEYKTNYPKFNLKLQLQSMIYLFCLKRWKEIGWDILKSHSWLCYISENRKRIVGRKMVKVKASFGRKRLTQREWINEKQKILQNLLMQWVRKA